MTSTWTCLARAPATADDRALSERAESGEPAKSWIERSWIERMTAFFQRGTEAVADAGATGLLGSNPGRVRATLRLTPHGKLVFEDKGDAPDLDARIALSGRGLCPGKRRGALAARRL